MIYGDSAESFQLMPSYLYMIQHCNPNSIVDLETNDQDTFLHGFMPFGASINGFLSSGRPVIVVDATHFKGTYKGVMFVVATKDGNEQIFPLAVGIGDKENDNSWLWFFRQLKQKFDIPASVLFVSDQHISIKNVVEVVFPCIPHALCVYHLQKNIAKYGAHIVSIFQKATNSYRREQCDVHLSHFALVPNQGAYRKLMDVEPARWAHSHCSVRRYKFMTSNCAEVLNGCLRWGRTLSLCTLLEFVRTLVAHWFVERRTKAFARTHELTEWAAKKLKNSVEEGRTMSVEPINLFKFTVSCDSRTYIVDLSAKSYTCREFDLNLIPCSHAAAAICKSKQSCASFVSSYYTTETLREMYSADVNPIPHPEEWCLPPEVSRRIVRTPNNPKQVGRPRTTRIQCATESSTRSHNSACSRCHRIGHYMSSCTEEFPIPQIQE